MRLILFLLLVLQLTHIGQLQAQAGTHKISMPVFGFINSSQQNNMAGAGIGLHFDDHEVGLLLRSEKFVGYGGGIYYRWYLPKTNLPCRPYLSLTGVRNHQIHQYHLGNTYYDGLNSGYWASFGVEFRFLKAFLLYGAIGYGIDGQKALGLPLKGYGTSGNFNFGLRYDLRLKGKRDTTWTVSKDFDGAERVSLSFSGSFYKNQPFGERANFFPSLEVRANSILHPYVGLFMGGIETGQPSYRRKDFLLKGVGLGIRFYTMSKPKFAVFQDVGYYQAKKREWNYNGSRFVVGNVFSYKLVPGLNVFGGMYLNFLRWEHYFEFTTGIRVDPGRWFAHNL